MPKGISTGALLIVGSVVVSLGLMEVGVRTFLPVYDPANNFFYMSEKDDLPPLGMPGKSLRQRDKSGEFDVSVRFNALGLRDRKILNRQTTAIAIGDSFTMGFGVEEEERFSNIMEDAVGMPIYNLALPTGLGGYAKQLAYAKKYTEKIETVILGLTVENDIFPIRIQDFKVRKAPDPADFDEAFSFSSLSDIKYFLARNSALYVFVRYTILNSKPLSRLFVKFGVVNEGYSRLHSLEATDESIRSAVAFIDHLTEPYRRLVVVIPSRWLWMGDLQVAASKTHNAVVMELAAAGVDYVDLRPVFERTGKPLAYYYPTDGHWTSEGHKLAAAAIVEHLKK